MERAISRAFPDETAGAFFFGVLRSLEREASFGIAGRAVFVTTISLVTVGPGTGTS